MKKEKIYLVVIIILVIILGVITFNYWSWRKTSFKLSNELYQVRDKWQIPSYNLDKEGNIINDEEELEAPPINNFSHIIVKGTIANTDILYTVIYTFDENDNVINIREKREFSTEQEAKEYYDEIQKTANDWSPALKVSLSGKSVVRTQPHSSDLNKERITEIYRETNGTTITEVSIY